MNLQWWTPTASLRVVRELLGIQKDGHGFCITKGFLEKYL